MSGFGDCGFGAGCDCGPSGAGCGSGSGVYEPRVLIGDLDLNDLPFILEFSYDLGNGVTVYDELESLLRDGTFVTSTRTSNRELKLSVLIKDKSGSQGRADAGVLLDTEVNRPINTVTLYPGDYGQPGAGPALVFDTFIAQSNHEWDGDLEASGYRRFILTIPALPGVRSLGLTTIEWNGPAEELRDTNTTTGWTSRTGGGVLSASGSGLTRTSSGDLKLRTIPTAPLRDFIYIRSNAGGGEPVIVNAVIGGVVIPEETLYKGPTGSNAQLIQIPVPAQFVGTTPEIDFDIDSPFAPGILYSIWTTNYPNIPNGLQPGGPGVTAIQRLSANFGIDRIDVGGTARTGCTISFTAPTGGAFVLTSRDPLDALRERGLSEMVFGRFTWASEGAVSIGGGVMWFPPGTHYTQIGRTAARPPQLYPNGMWPTQPIGGPITIGSDTQGSQYVYPADELAAVTFFNTTGAKNVISADSALQDGYQGDAVVFEEHVLHPDGTGFAVLDINGNPIPATVTYHKRWLHFPDSED